MNEIEEAIDLLQSQVLNYNDKAHGIKIEKARDIAIAALREKQQRENPEPLTREQLCKMEQSWIKSTTEANKQWIWIEDRRGRATRGILTGYWCVEIDYTEGKELCVNLPGCDAHFRWKDKGETWEAYAHKPSGEGAE